MNPANLPFDAEVMLAGLRPWVECESPTFETAAVDRMMDLVAYDLAAMGASVERIPGRLGFAGSVRATFPHAHAGKPGILISGHFDTVHPIGTLAELPFRVEGDKCYGPGILDMKAGNFLVLEAMRQLGRAGITTKLPVTVLFTPDEEVGTPSTRELIEGTAQQHRYVLVPEPGNSDGGVCSGRYAIARFDLETVGKPSHAGAQLARGKSAIREMARQLIAIEDMTSDDCTFSVGVIHGGTWVNCVSSTCRAEALSMAKKQEDLDRGVASMLALSDDHDGVTFNVTRGVTRPVWAPGLPGTMAVYELARDIAGELGFDLPHQSRPGGSDGNFTGALGIPTLDGLGALGADFHTLNEHIEVASLVDRGRLMAGLLANLA
jgi:glutamate carboxypeptidase